MCSPFIWFHLIFCFKEQSIYPLRYLHTITGIIVLQLLCLKFFCKSCHEWLLIFYGGYPFVSRLAFFYAFSAIFFIFPERYLTKSCISYIMRDGRKEGEQSSIHYNSRMFCRKKWKPGPSFRIIRLKNTRIHEQAAQQIFL